MHDATTRCVACDGPASGAHALPVDHSGDVVSIERARHIEALEGHGETANVEACAGCYAVHAASVADGAAVLAAHIEATADLRRHLADAVNALEAIRRTATSRLETLGEL